MITRRSLFATIAPMFLPIGALTDEDVPKQMPSVFDQIFSKPTGANGFEEIIRAGELAREIESEYHRRVDGSVSLAKKREFLAHPVIREASSLLRRGLAKPITIPEQDPFAEDQFTSFALIRVVARMLADEIYVCLADGRTDLAVKIVAEGLTLSYPLKSVSIIAGLVARAVESIVIAPLVRQIDSWSVRDCHYLIQLTEHWLALPDPAIVALAVERSNTFRTISRWREKPDVWCAAIENQYSSVEGESETPKFQRAQSIAHSLRTDVNLRTRICQEMEDALQYHFERANVLLRNPTGRMVLIPHRK